MNLWEQFKEWLEDLFVSNRIDGLERTTIVRITYEDMANLLKADKIKNWKMEGNTLLVELYEK